MIPAAEFKTASVKGTGHLIAEMCMELYAVFGQIFVFNLRVADAGVGSENILKRKRFFQRFIQDSAGACSFFVLLYVNCSFRIPAVGGAGDKRAGISVADNLTTLFGNEIGILLQGIGDPVSEFFYRGYGVFETDRGVGDVRCVNLQQLRCVFRDGDSDRWFVHGTSFLIIKSAF